MIENENNLLVVFEEHVRELIKLCDDRKRCIEILEAAIKQREEEIHKANQIIESLQSKYNYLLAVRRLASDETDCQNAREQVNKLVREVKTCIALLK